MPITLAAGETKRLDAGLIPIYIPPAPATIYGTVGDAATGYGIPGVLIQVATVASGYSGSDGSYQITDIPPGTYTVRFSKEGYETLIV